MRHSTTDDSIKSKLTSDDLKVLESAVSDALAWIEANPSASAEDMNGKHKDLEAKCSTIMSKIASGPAEVPGARSQNQGPTIDELD